MAESMKGKYVPVFLEWLDVTQDLTAEEKGNLIDAIVTTYKDGKEATDLSGAAFRKFIKLCVKINDFFNLENGRPAGQFHWHWKGGITPQNQKERSSGKYILWRTSVFVRDNFTCQVCGQVGGDLNAHHVKPWADNPALRFSVDNGVTLCRNCHNAVHGKKVRE